MRGVPSFPAVGVSSTTQLPEPSAALHGSAVAFTNALVGISALTA